MTIDKSKVFLISIISCISICIEVFGQQPSNLTVIIPQLPDSAELTENAAQQSIYPGYTISSATQNGFTCGCWYSIPAHKTQQIQETGYLRNSLKTKASSTVYQYMEMMSELSAHGAHRFYINKHHHFPPFEDLRDLVTSIIPPFALVTITPNHEIASGDFTDNPYQQRTRQLYLFLDLGITNFITHSLTGFSRIKNNIINFSRYNPDKPTRLQISKQCQYSPTPVTHLFLDNSTFSITALGLSIDHCGYVTCCFEKQADYHDLAELLLSQRTQKQLKGINIYRGNMPACCNIYIAVTEDGTDIHHVVLSSSETTDEWQNRLVLAAAEDRYKEDKLTDQKVFTLKYNHGANLSEALVTVSLSTGIHKAAASMGGLWREVSSVAQLPENKDLQPPSAAMCIMRPAIQPPPGSEYEVMTPTNCAASLYANSIAIARTCQSLIDRSLYSHDDDQAPAFNPFSELIPCTSLLLQLATPASAENLTSRLAQEYWTTTPIVIPAQAPHKLWSELHLSQGSSPGGGENGLSTMPSSTGPLRISLGSTPSGSSYTHLTLSPSSSSGMAITNHQSPYMNVSLTPDSSPQTFNAPKPVDVVLDERTLFSEPNSSPTSEDHSNAMSDQRVHNGSGSPDLTVTANTQSNISTSLPLNIPAAANQPQSSQGSLSHESSPAAKSLTSNVSPSSNTTSLSSTARKRALSSTGQDESSKYYPYPPREFSDVGINLLWTLQEKVKELHDSKGCRGNNRSSTRKRSNSSAKGIEHPEFTGNDYARVNTAFELKTSVEYQELCYKHTGLYLDGSTVKWETPLSSTKK